MAERAKPGIEVVRRTTNEPDTSHRCGYEYPAIWKMPDAPAVESFEQTVCILKL